MDTALIIVALIGVAALIMALRIGYIIGFHACEQSKVKDK